MKEEVWELPNMKDVKQLSVAELTKLRVVIVKFEELLGKIIRERIG